MRGKEEGGERIGVGEGRERERGVGCVGGQAGRGCVDRPEYRGTLLSGFIKGLKGKAKQQVRGREKKSEGEGEERKRGQAGTGCVGRPQS